VSDELLPDERKVVEALGDRPFDFRAMWAVSNLFRSATAVRRHMEATVLARDQISWTSFVGLWVLWVWGEIGANAFADSVGISKPTATGVLKTLQARGWTRRRPTPGDGRGVLLSLTPAGRAKIEQLFPRFNEEEAKVVSDLTDEEQEQLAATLRALARGVSGS
jgi:DNA-binding MarR family transcriptional regulator